MARAVGGRVESPLSSLKQSLVTQSVAFKPLCGSDDGWSALMSTASTIQYRINIGTISIGHSPLEAC